MIIKPTNHAVEQYVSRVKPCLGIAAARKELETLIRIAGAPTAEPPTWHHKAEYDSDYLHLSDGIACIVRRSTITTVLTRGGSSEEVRAQKKERKRKKQAKRRYSNNLSKSGGHQRGRGAEWA